jgi:hypothetical protein
LKYSLIHAHGRLLPKGLFHDLVLALMQNNEWAEAAQLILTVKKAMVKIYPASGVTPSLIFSNSQYQEPLVRAPKQRSNLRQGDGSAATYTSSSSGGGGGGGELVRTVCDATAADVVEAATFLINSTFGKFL